MHRHFANLALLFLFNTVVAVLLTVIEFGPGFRVNFVFSQCIGASVFLVNAPLAPWVAPGWRRWLLLAFTLPASVLLGVVLGHWANGMPLHLSPKFWQSLAIGLMFGIIGAVVFLLADRIHQLDDEVRQRRIEEAERGRRETEAHLKLLQAQIEPHFLFNTLANVASLIETDPIRARALLDRLNDWLRIALARTRAEQATLGDELALLEHWLAILGERFGPRLSWRIEADPATRALVLPPMLLQPLVENAVRHGLEPKVGGGSIRIVARLDGGRLCLDVHDDGVGLGHSAQAGQGTGLDNVRARLHALYGDAARLSLFHGSEGGTLARLELPCAA